MIKRVLIFSFIILLLLTVSCLLFLFLPPSLEATWDTSADKKIIEVGFAGEVDYNHIADVQIWGDGHIVWAKYDTRGKRQVFEGYLSQEEMTNIITNLIEAGFFDGYSRFDWDMQFGDYLSVSLSNIRHLVTIDAYSDYDNQQVLDIVEFLRKGAGVRGTEFIPESATLYAYPIEELDDYSDDTQANYKWPDNKFGYELKTVNRNEPNYERQLTGEELRFAWEVVNSPRPLVESEGKVYWIGIIIPKISL